MGSSVHVGYIARRMRVVESREIRRMRVVESWEIRRMRVVESWEIRRHQSREIKY